LRKRLLKEAAMNPTINDVARKAGVSTTTVSHIINGTRYVSDELKVKVEAAIRELGYRPNSLARGLRRGESKTLGLIVPDNSNPFFAEILRSIENIGYEHGYAVILCNSDDDIKKEISYTELLVAKQVDGIVFITTNNSCEHLQEIIDEGIPIVVIDRDIPLSGTDVLLVDNFHGGYMATRYLIELGHRRIACITGPSLLNPSADRVNGYKQALSEAGIPENPAWIVTGDFQYRGGELGIEQLLQLDERPTAVFACNDMMALGALRGLRKAKLSVPRDISLIGFDDISLTSVVSPALTSVAQPLHEISRLAFELLIERIQQKGENHEAKRIVLPTQIVERESCKHYGD
jgi:LacI family transcriptional regulator